MVSLLINLQIRTSKLDALFLVRLAQPLLLIVVLAPWVMLLTLSICLWINVDLSAQLDIMTINS